MRAKEMVKQLREVVGLPGLDWEHLLEHVTEMQVRSSRRGRKLFDVMQTIKEAEDEMKKLENRYFSGEHHFLDASGRERRMCLGEFIDGMTKAIKIIKKGLINVENTDLESEQKDT